MKSLILMLLIATSAHAQSLADAARMAREQRANQPKATHVFTTEEVRTTSPSSSVAPTAATAPTTPAAPAAAAAPAAVVAKPAVDPKKKYTDDLAKMKANVVELQDKESAMQLQINDLKNSITAPVVDQAIQAQAQAKLAETQNALGQVQVTLANARKAAADFEAQGPPKP